MKSVPNSFLGIAISVATSDETWMALPQQLLRSLASVLVVIRPQESHLLGRRPAASIRTSLHPTFHHRTRVRHSYRRLHLLMPKVRRKTDSEVGIDCWSAESRMYDCQHPPQKHG
jgi:hypothetical protein